MSCKSCAIALVSPLKRCLIKCKQQLCLVTKGLHLNILKPHLVLYTCIKITMSQIFFLDFNYIAQIAAPQMNLNIPKNNK